MVATDYVTGRIVQRYAHPGRSAYLYMFQLAPDGDFSALIPPVVTITAAWVDEGSGIQPISPAAAVEHCQAAKESVGDPAIALRTTRHERRQMMARVILFSVTQLSETAIQVHLVSRALAFAPKGTREVVEEWRPTAEGWYSTYRDHE